MKGFQLRLVSLLLLLTACAYAVEVTARIRGTVTDPTGAVLPNITVTATNQDTGVVTTTTTMANGDYIFQKLPIGTYSVNATAPALFASRQLESASISTRNTSCPSSSPSAALLKPSKFRPTPCRSTPLTCS